MTGSYPLRVTVIGFDFKAQRFTDLHRKAIGFPKDSFAYIGMRPENGLFDHNTAEEGERGARQAFESDMYGCQSKELSEKKSKRNPFRRSIPYVSACPELVSLLSWCGPGTFDVTSLPWYQYQSGRSEREDEGNGGHVHVGSSSSSSSNFLTSSERMNRGYRGSEGSQAKNLRVVAAG